MICLYLTINKIYFQSLELYIHIRTIRILFANMKICEYSNTISIFEYSRIFASIFFTPDIQIHILELTSERSPAKMVIFVKNGHFGGKWSFWWKMVILVENGHFGRKQSFCSKMVILVENGHFGRTWSFW